MSVCTKGWLPSGKLKPTFTFLVRDFAIFDTFTWQNPYQEKVKVGFNFALGSQPFSFEDFSEDAPKGHRNSKTNFHFFGRDFAIFNTFTWQNTYQKSESCF